MPKVCLYCHEVFIPNIHRTECTACGYWVSENLFETESTNLESETN